MRTMLTIASAGGIALLLASGSAGTPPPELLHIAVTHEQPTAGRLFAGFAFTPVGDARITQVECDATIGHKQLRGRQHRFYADGVSGPAAVTCGWRIPTGTGRKRLSLTPQEGRACVMLVQGGGQSTTVCSPVLSWRIKP